MPKHVAHSAMGNRDAMHLCECRRAFEIAGGHRGHFHLVNGAGRLDRRLCCDPRCSDDTDPYWAASLAGSKSEAAR